MRLLPWLAIWLATGVGGWLLGREQAPRDEAPLLTPVERGAGPRGGGAEAAAAGGAPSLSAAPVAPRPTGARAVERLRPPPVAEVAPGAPLELASAATVDELMARLFAYLAAQLAAGPEGHKAAFRALDRALRDDQRLRQVLRSEEELAPHLYAWIRFLVDRDAQVVDLAETLFRSAAEDPAVFEGTDDDTFELITEGLGPLLPGMVSGERLERLRGHVARALESLPTDRAKGAREARPGLAELAKSRGDLERLLRAWTPRLGSAEAAARLRSGAPAHEILALLRQVAPGDRAGLDLVALLGPVVASGDLRSLRADIVAGLDARDRSTLDERLLTGPAVSTLSEWHLFTWLEATGRPSFEAARPFVELALGKGGQAADLGALVMLRLRPPPSAEAADALLSAYTVTPRIADAVRAATRRR